ncbi:MAG TPA: RdgB/HAM1 family non-canonical purine NTP pyrophosphatase [Opitutales bacterium]|nr:RdgB/HAM1 family non-canonical purine NTP pyrophosphatase [Opitutales bacterium]
MKRLIIATGNPHKVGEFAQLLKGAKVEVQSAAVCGGMPEVEENGTTFAENAQLKAEALREVAPSDAWVLADDSGLEVDALHGEPGIYSARYAGEGATDLENLEKLLRALTDVPEAERTARFRCALCLIGPDGRVFRYEGSCEGRIRDTAGGTSGFGYDPVFIPAGYEESFAELGDAVKAKLSHRAKAVGALLAEFSRK